jgi:GMP synthase (glutamine-hydrolysing)
VDKVLILDFGSQTTQLIGRRIREAGVYTDIVPGDVAFSPALLEGVKGLVFSGSPSSVYEEGAPAPDRAFYEAGIPVLGICYGLQRMMKDHGGEVERLHSLEFGRERVAIEEPCPILEGVDSGFVSWMSHGDSVKRLAPGFRLAARSESGFPAVVAHAHKPLYGVQFHPEVSHCERGGDILKNFVLGVCGARPEWTMARYIEDEGAAIRARAGARPVLLLISGGVDSTVVGAFLLKALDPAQVHLLYIDTGLMRKDESVEVERSLRALGATHLTVAHAEDEFLSALAGVEDPERKREIIGDLFIKVQEREVTRMGIPGALLAQGTLYTDLIESGKGVGKKAHVIKSHHNVRSPLVEAKRAAGLVIEPLERLYKDEVRALGRALGVSEEVVRRHPFPGPGLGVRILGEVTREKCDILREADAIYIAELKRRGLYDAIWQAFAVLLPVRSVGVAGDVRRYGYVLALRAIVSADGMTADVYPFAPQDLLEISNLITNRVKEIGRVVYDVSSKPPATIEWE